MRSKEEEGEVVAGAGVGDVAKELSVEVNEAEVKGLLDSEHGCSME